MLVVGNADNYLLSRADFSAAGVDQYTEIIEALPRNTAAAIAFAALAVEPDDILLITPSDHIIFNAQAYNQCLNKAIVLAKEGYLVTFGIKPNKPETGYGYIEFEGDNVLSFKEKPSFSQAEAYVQSGRFLWNSGMFCFKAAVFLEELQKYEPEIYTASLHAWQTRQQSFLGEKESKLIPSKSVDYAVMERSDKIKVIEADLDWSDLGSFDALWEFMDKTDKNTNRKNLLLGTQKHIEILGLENVIFVETDDAILVMPREYSQQVKNIYEKLQNENPGLV